MCCCDGWGIENIPSICRESKANIALLPLGHWSLCCLWDWTRNALTIGWILFATFIFISLLRSKRRHLTLEDCKPIKTQYPMKRLQFSCKAQTNLRHVQELNRMFWSAELVLVAKVLHSIKGRWHGKWNWFISQLSSSASHHTSL